MSPSLTLRTVSFLGLLALLASSCVQTSQVVDRRSTIAPQRYEDLPRDVIVPDDDDDGPPSTGAYSDIPPLTSSPSPDGSPEPSPQPSSTSSPKPSPSPSPSSTPKPTPSPSATPSASPSPSTTPTPTPSATPTTPPPPTFPVIGGVDLEANPAAAAGLPMHTDVSSDVLISRPQYLLSWNTKTHLINFALWTLKSSNFGSSGRQDEFETDADLVNYLKVAGFQSKAVSPGDFSGSCFDRGHQVPSADRTANDDDNKATFLMSNIIPQSALTNRVMWAHLEGEERRIARANKTRTFLVVAGPVFPKNAVQLSSRKDIPIPEASFKIIALLDATGKKVDTSVPPIVAILPNVTSKGTNALVDRDGACKDSASDIGPGDGNRDDWQPYKSTLKDVEERTGLTFGYLH